jgi:hypothetical protein
MISARRVGPWAPPRRWSRSTSVWVIDPRRRRAFIADGAALLPVEILTVPGTAIRIVVAEIFAGLDALKAQSSAL